MFTPPLNARRRWPALIWATVIATAAAGCAGIPDTALQQLVEARQLSSDLLVHFTKASDTANLAVMADTDEASVAFARESGQAGELVGEASAALGPKLASLGYSSEARLLEEFTVAFTEYRALDQTILGLAVENTNLKAQRLSFGPAHEAADAFKMALETVKPAAPADAWRVTALIATAVASVREIQVSQAPHIAEPDDARMAAIEKAMSVSAAVTRDAVTTLRPLASAASQGQLAAASAALDRFVAVNVEIVTLSRRNTNVRSLALSLGRKRILTAKCEETLRALQTALSMRQIGGTR